MLVSAFLEKQGSGLLPVTLSRGLGNPCSVREVQGQSLVGAQANQHGPFCGERASGVHLDLVEPMRVLASRVMAALCTRSGKLPVAAWLSELEGNLVWAELAFLWEQIWGSWAVAQYPFVC